MEIEEATNDFRHRSRNTYDYPMATMFFCKEIWREICEHQKFGLKNVNTRIKTFQYPYCYDIIKNVGRVYEMHGYKIGFPSYSSELENGKKVFIYEWKFFA